MKMAGVPKVYDFMSDENGNKWKGFVATCPQVIYVWLCTHTYAHVHVCTHLYTVHYFVL